ncbi:MAG: hypothetical protein ACRD3B_08720 [Candidatus Sulfotelmatobacter sp.]
MFTSMLQLAISMSLLYLLLSAASSALQELIANFLHWRADTLEEGIAGLFNDEKFKDALYQVPLIKGLLNPRGGKPSYIPPATFALAVLKLAGSNILPGSSDDELGDLGADAATAKAAASKQIYPGATALLQSLLLGATTVEQQKKRLEDWFNDSTSRISGWYKRKAHAALWIIGALLCVVANADSISLANTFWNDPALRSAMVTAANEYVKNPKPQTPDRTPADSAAGKPISSDSQGAHTAYPGNATGSDKNAFDRLNDVRTKLATINVPLGWCWQSAGEGGKPEKICFPNLAANGVKDLKAVADVGDTSDVDPRMVHGLDDIYWWLLKLLGLAATTLAVSQGAPFWFDLLQKAVNVRLSGNAPDEKQKK